MFDSQLIEQVIDLWSQARVDGRSGQNLRFSHVKDLMETVFLASLKREEEHPVQVSVSLLDPREMEDEARHPTTVAIRLDRRLPFSVESLAKLSAAFDHTTTALGVFPMEEDPNLLEIWGAVFSSRRGRNRFDALQLERNPPDALSITTSRPGALLLLRGGNLIARFANGRFSEPTPTPFTSSLMGWSLLKVIKAHPEFRSLGTKYWRTYRDLIDRLLVESSKRGHGGTIVWLPEAEVASTSEWFQTKYELGGSPEGGPILERMCQLDIKRGSGLTALEAEFSAVEARNLEESFLDCKRHLVEHVELLAQLTRVDGALIITDRLRPLSFGTVLTAPVWGGKTVWGPDNETSGTDDVVLSRYGTRHNSAVNFVGKVPSAVVFVLSQDGPIAGLTQKDPGTIYWWPDCLSKLWTV